MSGTPRVSVCVANYNGAAMIAGCLDSVLTQKGDFEVEILVHDDASSDASVEIISLAYPVVRMIRSADNVGFCIANNRMVAAALGEYVLLLNNDAELLPDALHHLLAAAEAAPSPVLLSLPQYDYDSGALIDRGCLLDPFYNPVPNLDPERREVAMAIGACLWLPRNLWNELGGFPEWFGSIGEDLYLCCRARLVGYPVRVLDVSGYSHRVGASFGGGKVRDGRLASTFRRRALSERNKTYVMALTCPALFMPVILPMHILMLFCEGVLLSLFKRRTAYLTEIYLPVFVAIYRRKSSLWDLRTAIHQHGQVASTDFFSVFDWIPYKLRMLFKHGLPRLI
ncbi:glycosyltransferase family 2 protein [Dechloromonas sp. A34]|uniref:glycosyltransferase family 2 protein n=1 Tax=Dechloromonas sp. A34 TaxID=447588 RepID=UPI0022488D1C|nr:glycosyltransferase family 2 protein [Dechloromonas sp. A34]